MKGDLIYTWEAFLTTPLLRFGTTLYEHPQAALKELKQTNIVAEYQSQFEDTSMKLTGLSEPWLISFLLLV